MKDIKKYLKILIGVAVIILFAIIFFMVNKSRDLENANMKNWASASFERRESAVKILIGGEMHTELMIECLDKISALPDSGGMTVRDAASLCFIGIELKNNI